MSTRRSHAAKADADGWRQSSPSERTDDSAPRRRDARRCAAAISWGPCWPKGARLFAESDPEVSEAIDFCRFYSRTAERILRTAGISKPRAREWWSSFRPGIFRSRFPAAAWRRHSRRQHGDPQAGQRHGAGRLRTVPVFLGGRRATHRIAIRPLQWRHAWASSWSRTTESMP